MRNDVVLRSLVSVGLATKPNKSILFTDEPKLHSYVSYPTQHCISKYKFTEESAGTSTDIDEVNSKIRAAAECLERLCLFNFDDNSLTYPYRYENQKNFVDPAVFSHYRTDPENTKDSDEEIRKQRYRWKECHDYFNNGTIMIPAQVIYLCGTGDEFSIQRESISTGAALGGVDEERAFDNGLLEVVERDACISSYLRRQRLISPRNMSEKNAKLLDYLKRYNLETFNFFIPNDFNVPVSMTIVIDRTPIGPAVSIGSKASYSYDDALLGSILESVQCRSYARFNKNLEFPERLPTESEITDLKNRLFYWYSTDRIRDLDFWLKSYQKVDIERQQTSQKQLLDSFKERGYKVYIADITLPEIRDSGFQITKVIIPELHPLYLDERAKAFYSVHHGLIEEDAGLKPHPFT